MPQRGLSALSVSTIRASEKASVRGMGKEESHVSVLYRSNSKLKTTILGFYRIENDRCTINIHSLDMNHFLVRPYG